MFSLSEKITPMMHFCPQSICVANPFLLLRYSSLHLTGLFIGLYDLWLGFPSVLRIVEPFNSIFKDDHANFVAQPLSVFFGEERHILLSLIPCQKAETINSLDVLTNECRVRVGLRISVI